MKVIVCFIGAIFLLTTSQISASEKENQRKVKESIATLLTQIPGWCSQQKAEAMMDLVFSTQPKVCVEIGVFAGKSIVPTAYALKYLEKGVVYAVDSWKTKHAIECYEDGDANIDWWSKIDMENMYNFFTHLIQAQGMQKHCIIIRDTSKKAASKIGAIDILHIDGNHCDRSALTDVKTYLPKVRVGGYIWFEGWANSPKAYTHAKQVCQVKKVVGNGTCILLEKVISE